MMKIGCYAIIAFVLTAIILMVLLKSIAGPTKKK